VVVKTEGGAGCWWRTSSQNMGSWAALGRFLGLRCENPTKTRHCDDRLAFPRISHSLILSSLIPMNFFVMIQTYLFVRGLGASF
jgi:hypothetical protein